MMAMVLANILFLEIRWTLTSRFGCYGSHGRFVLQYWRILFCSESFLVCMCICMHVCVCVCIYTCTRTHTVCLLPGLIQLKYHGALKHMHNIDTLDSFSSNTMVCIHTCAT
jgi:hypothetical protein